MHRLLTLGVPSVSLSWNRLLDAVLHKTHAVLDDADVRKSLLQNDRIHLGTLVLLHDFAKLRNVHRIPVVLRESNRRMLLNLDSVACSQLR